MADLQLRLVSVLGLAAMIGFAWLLSTDRRSFPVRVVGWGLALQLAVGLVLLRTELGQDLFLALNRGVVALLGYTDAGVRFVFGPIAESGFSLALGVLPVIIFTGSLIGMLYHVGAIQFVIRQFARLLARTMGLSGAESVAAAANVFVGMTEAPLMVRPYVPEMTRSELFCLMSTGMATVAGSVLIAYSQMLGGGPFAGHLIAASVISAPAGILIAKVMVPERERAATGPGSDALTPRTSVNLIDAASEGALSALRLAAYVGALLLVFVALVALLNDAMAWVGTQIGVPGLSLQRVLGWLFAPLAWLMGISWEEAPRVGALLGVKTVLNEFLAFRDLATAIENGSLSVRAQVIASYALCGFANFGSLAILLGGVGGIAPARRSELARFGLRGIAAGTLATLMTGCVAGLFL